VDEPELRSFVREVYPRLVGTLAVVCRSRAVAEDAVQEALARAWERIQRGEHIDSLPAWVTAVSLNLARNRFRSLRAETRAKHRLMGGRPEPEPATRVGDRIDVLRAVAGLSRKQREATMLRYYLDLDVAAVAAAMSVPEGTAKSLLSRARTRLAATLAENDPEEVTGHARR
jgi:RNA polymerase sigma-70 factor (ECF subfamily)